MRKSSAVKRAINRVLATGLLKESVYVEEEKGKSNRATKTVRESESDSEVG
jgi:hypothetical protein